MTYAPQTLQDLRSYLRIKTGLSFIALGIVGDAAHRGGYHCGSDRVITGDYSVVESTRDSSGLTLAASAIDIGAFSKGGKNLRQLSAWLVEQCRQGAPGTNDIREIIYTTDGRTVRRWDSLRRRSSGDNSHLWHTHISYFRDSERREKLSLFKRFFEGTSPPPNVAEPPVQDWSRALMAGLPTLKQGNRGMNVRRLQGLLAAAGYPPLNTFIGNRPDGVFGSNTTTALKRFQVANNVRNSVFGGQGDGICGRYTWEALLKG